MCGIWFLSDTNKTKDVNKIHKAFMKIAHRGPDYYTLKQLENNFLGFHRLAIMDLSEDGNQPFVLQRDDGTMVYCVCNGEIYNYEQIKQEYNIKTKPKASGSASCSDCEIILPLYEKLGIEKTIQKLGSEFAFIILEISPNGKTKVIAGRDPLGVRPLFFSEDENGICLTSEIKGIIDLYKDVKVFPPGHYMIYDNNQTEFHEYYNCLPQMKMKIPNNVQEEIRSLLIDAVNIRMNSDREIGFLLSGGVDSSLICGIAKYLFPDKKFTAFTISFTNGVDLPYAKEVVQHLDWEHHIINIDETEALNVIDKTIYQIESYDITTVRCSVLQYLLAKYIKENTNIRVLLCGEGSDEIFSGYLYHHYAPSSDARYMDSYRLIHDIHTMDGLRTDRTMAGYGLEVRLPFLDHRLVSYIFDLYPQLTEPKNGMEKSVLRESFRDLKLVPESILFRTKNAFSDSVTDNTRSWYDIVTEHIDTIISHDEYQHCNNFKHCKPITKESYYYRKKFTEYFGESETTAKTIPYFWMPKWVESTDPSARKIGILTE